MSRRYWIAGAAALALFFLLAILSGVLYLSGQREQAEQASSEYRAYAERAVSCEGVEPLSARYACLLDAVEAEQQRIYAHANLRAQQDMAVWTFGMLWASVALLIVTSVGVVYVALTLKEAKDATRAAADAAVAAEKPQRSRVTLDRSRLELTSSLRKSGWIPRIRMISAV